MISQISLSSEGDTEKHQIPLNTTPGPYAQWIKKNITSLPVSVFRSGLSFIHKNKIYWGFSKLTFNQTQSDYLILDLSAANPQWLLGPAPPVDMVPPGLQNATAVVLGNRVYFGTGLSPAANSRWWEYDPEANTSKRLTDYPEATTNALSFMFNDKVYTGFGGTSKKLHEFDQASNGGLGSWKHIADAAVREMGSSSAMVIGNNVFIGRGILDPNGERKSFFTFDGSNNVTLVTGLPETIQSPQTPSFVIDNKGYFITNTKVWEYTPGTGGGTWRIVLSTGDSPAIYGWNNLGEVYEFKLN